MLLAPSEPPEVAKEAAVALLWMPHSGSHHRGNCGRSLCSMPSTDIHHYAAGLEGQDVVDKKFWDIFERLSSSNGLVSPAD